MRDNAMSDNNMAEVCEKLLEEMIESQQARLLAHARRIIPYATYDDVLQPNDFPELEGNADFRYEEGYLAALLGVQIAMRAKIRQQ